MPAVPDEFAVHARRHGKRELQVRELPGQKGRGPGEDGQQSLDLPLAASGEDAYAPGVAGGVQNGVRADGVQQGVADIVHGHAVAGIELDLEGQDTDEAVHMAAQEIDAAFAPGPELGTDVIDHGDVQALGDLGHAEMKVGGVDEHHDVRTKRGQTLPDGAQQSKDFRQLGQYLGESHDRK